MGNKGRRHRRGGRVTAKGTRPRAFGPAGPSTAPSGEPDLLAEIRLRLREAHPFAMLAEASGLYAALDPRDRNPFAQGPSEEPTQEQLVASFLEVDGPETSALLHVFAELTEDDVLRARIRRELARRSHSLPEWVTSLAQVEPYRAVEMVHVLGDGDNVILGVRLPHGYELTVVVYIDHNLGTVVKDAYVIPEPMAQVVDFMREKTNRDPDMAWNDIDLADARSRVTQAVDSGAMTLPRFQTDTWPACRPLVEWMARRLPEGGQGYEPPEWDDAALDKLSQRFLESPYAETLAADGAQVELLDSLLWFASGYGPGDPLRWSPVAVEILLLDWVPRKIASPARVLAKMPDLLRAFIRFSHFEKGIRTSLTAETLEAVDRWEPEYQQAIRSDRPQGPMALLAAMGALDPDGGWDMAGEDLSYTQIMRESLERAVGGRDALDHLGTEPLPAEELDWAGIPDDVHPRLREVLDLCDRCCQDLLDQEFQTACRRLLARVARGDPNMFRRAGRADTAAAAVCWAVGKANDLFSPIGRGMLVKDLLAHFAIKQGSVSQRAETSSVRAASRARGTGTPTWARRNCWSRRGESASSSFGTVTPLWPTTRTRAARAGPPSRVSRPSC